MQRLVDSTITEVSFNLEKSTPISPCDYPKKSATKKLIASSKYLSSAPVPVD